jgi:hypothetical protein
MKYSLALVLSDLKGFVPVPGSVATNRRVGGGAPLESAQVTFFSSDATQRAS